MAKISIWSKDIEGGYSVDNKYVDIPDHTYLLFEYDDGSRYIFRAGPDDGVPTLGLADYKVVVDIYSQEEHGADANNDWDGNENHTFGDDLWSGTDDELDLLKNRAETYATNINDSDFGYYPLLQNCHTAVSAFLAQENLFDGSPYDLFSQFSEDNTVWSLFPAWGQEFTESPILDEIAGALDDALESLGEVIDWSSTSVVEIYNAFSKLLEAVDSGTWNEWEFSYDSDGFFQLPSFSNAESITSPISIDLSADGLETTSKSDGVYFDHDNNGLAEKSGWVAPDDGLLVRDLNGDGAIDGGAELFGNNTALADGTQAANGFEALAELDANTDGVIDAQEAAYADLRVWRDLNQDGVSQTDELFTLEEAGVSSISTQYQSVNQDDGQGNTIKQMGSATLVDGTVTTAADVWFDTNQTRTKTVDSLEVSDAVAALPTAQGFGNLHNLDQAMMRDTELQVLVAQFVAEDDDSARRAMMDELIYQWAGVADVDPNSRDASRIYGHVMDARQLETLEELVGREYLGTWCWGERDPNPHGRAAPVLIAQYEEYKSSIYGQLMAQSHYQEAFDQIGIRFDVESGNFVPDMDAFTTHLEELAQSGDVADVSRIYAVLGMLGTYSSAYEGAAAELTSNPLLAVILADNLVEGSEGDDTLSGSNGDDLIIGGKGNDTLLGRSGDDTYLFEQGDGADRIYDAAGTDTLSFGQGIAVESLSVSRNATTLFITVLGVDGLPTGDALQLDNVFDFDGTIREGAIESFLFSDGSSLLLDDVIGMVQQTPTEGDDVLYGTAQADTFEALAGNDTVYGGAGDDIYRFTFGDGQDTIFENAGADTIEFTDGIQAEQVRVERTGLNGEDILLHLYDDEGLSTGDSIRIVKAYQDFSVSGNAIETVRFTLEDGAVQTLALGDLDKLFNVTELDDVVYGFESDDHIQALQGVDTVHAAGGADVVNGNEHDDSLYGEAGDDLLIGGKGNDTLNGGSGNDRYLFASGDGHDVIQNNDAAGIDVLEFDASINPNKVRLLRIDNDLLISIDRNTDSVQISDYFNGESISPNAIDEIRFADGSVLTLQDVMEMTLMATQSADYIEGFSSDDAIAARGGDDIVYAKSGNDMVSGGQGNDLIFGENGNDMLFGQQGADQLFGGQGDDIIYGGAEQDQLYGSSGKDTLYGGFDSDLLVGGSQDDALYGENGVDTLQGEHGQDLLNGGNGDDLLVGGQDNDILIGGLGDDTYQYSIGDGKDQIETGNKESLGHDTLTVTGATFEQLWLAEDGDDLVVSFMGSNGEVRVNNWQAKGSAIDEIQVAGHSADSYDIERLVNAMAVFDVPSGAGAIVPQDTKDQLAPVLASSWQPLT